jgi:BASS family bile acid:Na+ symporter
MHTEDVIKLLNVTALVTLMLSIGLRVRFDEVLRAARQVRAVSLGLLANFVAVPLITVGLLLLFQATSWVSTGFLILAVCPGAPVGPSFTGIAKGDVALATGLMVILAGASAVLAPALLSILLFWLFPGGQLFVDFVSIVRTLLVTQLVPLAVGLAIHHWASRFGERAAKPLALLANVMLLSVVGLILATQYPTLADIRLRGWFGMLLLLLASLVIGWLCGGSARPVRSALAVTTGLRNTAVGLVIVNANFAGTPAVTAVVAYALVTIFGTLLFSFLLAS